MSDEAQDHPARSPQTSDRSDDRRVGQSAVDTQPIHVRGVVLIDLRHEIAQVDAALPDTPEGGTAVLSNPTAVIKVVRLYPGEIQLGDYVQRRRPFRSLKILCPPRRMGDVVRLEGVSSDVGSEVFYPKAGIPLDVVRGYPAGTLPEEDDDRLGLIKVVESEGGE